MTPRQQNHALRRAVRQTLLDSIKRFHIESEFTPRSIIRATRIIIAKRPPRKNHHGKEY